MDDYAPDQVFDYINRRKGNVCWKCKQRGEDNDAKYLRIAI